MLFLLLVLNLGKVHVHVCWNKTSEINTESCFYPEDRRGCISINVQPLLCVRHCTSLQGYKGDPIDMAFLALGAYIQTLINIYFQIVDGVVKGKVRVLRTMGGLTVLLGRSEKASVERGVKDWYEVGWQMVGGRERVG